MIEKPSILIVDDEPDLQSVLATQLASEASVAVRHPQETRLDDLFDAQLILVDFRLDSWPERESIAIPSLNPTNGLALAAVLRSHVSSSIIDNINSKPRAIALHSSHLSELAGGLPQDTREHAIARANNLEWAFEKSSSQASNNQFRDQLTSLAAAVNHLPTSWPQDPDALLSTMAALLMLDESSPWFVAAITDIESCHPPIHELSLASHGLALLRWLLHRILPYPCFLLDQHYLAARLGVTIESLRSALEQQEFAKLFGPCRYEGLLKNFLGQRWWSAAVEALLWDITSGNSIDSSHVHAKIREKSGIKLSTLPFISPVVGLDVNYKPLPELTSAADSLRIQPDDWPPYAQNAWTTKSIAEEHAHMQSLVIALDRERLVAESPGSGLSNA